MSLTKILVLVASLSASAFAAVHTDTVYLCGTVATYVDGGLYVLKNSDGSSSGQVGSHLNGATKFDFNLALTDPANKQPYGPEHPILLTEAILNTGNPSYRRYNLTPYIDVSPGAFAPLRFTSDNSTLAPGETAWGWMAVAGIILWSPTGHIADAPPPPPGSSAPFSVTQGWQLVQTTADSSVYRVYWNQTRYAVSENVRGSSYALAQCSTDVPPYNFVDNL